MKKCLLTLAISLLLGSSFASAEAVKAPFAVKQTEAAQSRAATDDGYDLRFCGDLYSWYRLTDRANTTYRCYIEISPEVATSLAGNTLTDITFSVCLQSAKTKPGTVFISEDINSDPVVSQDVTIVNGYNGSYGTAQTVELATPYVIKEGVGFCMGYTVTKCAASDYPVGVDETAATPYAGTGEVFDSKGNLLTQADLASEAGVNLFLYATTVGEKKELNNVFALADIMIGAITLPVVDASTGSVNVYAYINNIGSNNVTSVDYTYSLNGGDDVTGSVECDVPGSTMGEVAIPIELGASGRNSLEVKVNSINGLSCDKGAKFSFISLDNEGYDRKFVVEEGTGTGCGYCPRGIVGMETMSENYPEKFIGIAVHCDWFGADPMTVSSYQPLLNKYFSGLPSAIVNRDPIFNIDPSPELLDFTYQYWNAFASVAAADVDLKVEKPAAKATSMKVKASTVFAFEDAAASYSLAFVIIEDGIKGFQSNYYSGGQNGPMGGWESKPSRAAWTYLDTARDIFNVWGITGSIPSSVEKGISYEYDYDLKLSNVKDIEKTSVVALILDKTSGTILNAKKVEYEDYTDPIEDGITDITADASAPVEYYNIQGVRMDGDNLPAGLYIIRQGDKVQKTIIR